MDGRQAQPPGFSVIALPWADDIRDLKIDKMAERGLPHFVQGGGAVGYNSSKETIETPLSICPYFDLAGGDPIVSSTHRLHA